MKIVLENISKSFGNIPVFHDVHLTFEASSRYALTGPNGSGKSTLLQVLAGYISPSHGALSFTYHKQALAIHEIFRYISFAGPYMDLPAEMTLHEFVTFHFRFKSVLPGVSIPETLAASGLESHLHKPLKHFSSGMRQKVKLLSAMLADTPVLLLDEPGSNLDNAGMEFYHNLMKDCMRERLVIIASNHNTAEYPSCKEILDMVHFK